MLRWLWGAVAQWSEHLQLRIQSPAATRFFFFVCLFFSSSWLPDVGEMKDLWCSSTVWLLSTQTQVNVKAP